MLQLYKQSLYRSQDSGEKVSHLIVGVEAAYFFFIYLVPPRRLPNPFTGSISGPSTLWNWAVVICNFLCASPFKMSYRGNPNPDGEEDLLFTVP